MSIITLTAILVTFCALFAFVNYHFLKLPTTIGIMVIALVLSGVILALPLVGLDISATVENILNNIDFSEALLHGMLSFLLFAGALHVELDSLKKQKYIIGILAVCGTIFSTVVVGYSLHYLAGLFGLEIALIYCFLFGSLISPTDPIAVMAILRKAGISEALRTKVVGESLFNDGIAVVIFVTLLGVANSGSVEIHATAILFLQEAVGGLILGFVLGYITFIMLRSVDNYQVEIFLTLALVMGGYELALFLHTSGPIAMVVSGLLIGNLGRTLAMSDKTKENLDNFWELIDEFLNALLFMLIGFEILILTFNQQAFYIGLIMIPLLLLIRFISVKIPVKILRNFREFDRGVSSILTWGGLRGGISVALVLSLPHGEVRDILLLITYIIVMFSIIVQGLTISKLAVRFK